MLAQESESRPQEMCDNSSFCPISGVGCTKEYEQGCGMHQYIRNNRREYPVQALHLPLTEEVIRL